MPTTTINHILDPIGNRANNRPKPALYWRYVNMYRRYGVKIEWLQNGETETLHQQITMHCTHIQNEKVVWKIHKQYFFINEYKPENPTEELYIACTEQLYPMQLLVDKSGQLDNILNIKEIQQRFATAKPTLLRDFSGPLAEQYIQQTEGILHNHKHIAKAITTDIWLSLFFSPIYSEYDSETFSIPMYVSFPFYGFEQPLIFKTEATVDLNPTDIETYTLTCQGKLDTNQLSNAVQYRYNPTAGSIDTTYHLDQGTHQIQSITGKVTIQEEDDDEISQVTISAYTLHNEEKIEPINPNPEKKKKTWWASLFEN